MNSLFQKILSKASRAILKKYKPKIVAITGSIGKTSAKEAIFAVVSARNFARKNIKNYNNEFGLPLTIIGAESPGRNSFGWLKVFAKALAQIYFYSHYPKILVLEVGIDRLGDMDKMMDIIRPDIGVLTTIGISHLEYFSDEQEIFEEKVKIFRDMEPKDVAVLNSDDSKVRQAIARVKTKIITYGFDTGADLRISDFSVAYSKNNSDYGTMFRLHFKGADVPVFLSGTLGLPHVYAAAVGAAVGVNMGMSLTEIASALTKYQPEPGRMRAIEGEHGSVIIDDTYNSAPLSSEVAVAELGRFPAKRKIAVLGDMLELGEYSERAHREVAAGVAATKIDYAVFVGPQMRLAYTELGKTMFNPAHLFWFEKSTDAIDKVRDLLAEDVVVLIKGSQGMRMEKIVKEIMRDKNKASKLLARQGPEWLKK